MGYVPGSAENHVRSQRLLGRHVLLHAAENVTLPPQPCTNVNALGRAADILQPLGGEGR